MMSIVAQSIRPAREEVRERLAGAGFNPTDLDFAELIKRGWMAEAEEGLSLTEAGQRHYVDLLVRLKDFEDRTTSDFTDSELADARAFLRRLVQKTAEGVPSPLG